jgi:hypothetical protein
VGEVDAGFGNRTRLKLIWEPLPGGTFIVKPREVLATGSVSPLDYERARAADLDRQKNKWRNIGTGTVVAIKGRRRPHQHQQAFWLTLVSKTQ